MLTPLEEIGFSHRQTSEYQDGLPALIKVGEEGSTLLVQPGAQSAAPLEATAQDKFELSVGVVFEFDVAKNQMIQKRGSRERVFTKEK